MKYKELKIDFRYLGENIACLSADSINGKEIHNDINNDEAIIIFNSLVGEKENCITVKTLIQENKQLKDQLKQSEEVIEEAIEFLKHIINYLEKKDMFHNYESELLDILNKYKKEESDIMDDKEYTEYQEIVNTKLSENIDPDCEEFYFAELESKANNCDKYRQALNEIKKYIHSEEFFMLMNSNSIDDKNKSVCEDYFKAQGKLDNILDKVLGESL